MRDNRLHYSFALCLLVLVSLLLLSYLPDFSIGAWKLKRVDLLADIRPEKPETIDTLQAKEGVESDSVRAQVDSVARVARSGCKPGITCIEDYSGDSTALLYFLKALHALKENKKSVRVAMYGDSFIEGDVFCGSFRDTLQTLLGGRGVGYVPITSEVAGFRNTIKHQFGHWRTFSLISKKDSTVHAEIGPAGFCFLPKDGNWVEYRPSKQRYLRDFPIIKLYYKNLGKAMLHYAINDSIQDSVALRTSDRLREWKYYKAKANAVKFQFTNADSLQLYGASFEDAEGIYVDNFSLRGNSGIVLHNVPDAMYEEFNQYRDYKLIVLQYGLNVVREDSVNYTWYAERMIRVVNKIKRVFPKASIVLLSVSDRSTNTSGTFKTMPAIPAMRNAQRYIAQQTGIAFWDLYEAMGGENSMVTFAEGKPVMAAKDYTHLNFKGGRKISQRFVNSLLYELEKYENTLAH